MQIIWLITLLATAQAGPPKSSYSRGKIDWSHDCGISRKIPIASRIVGGQGAPAGDWPWMAAILYQGRLRCGGTLISDRHVLTNARSAIRLKATSVTVRLGQQPLSETEKEAEYAVEEIIIHPDYDIDSRVDDIAVLKLAQSVKVSEDVHRICLPPPDQEPEKKIGYIAGWGFTEHQGELSDDLQEIEVPIWSNNLCQAALNVTILRSQLCAGRIAGGADSCRGDAGGPLMIAAETGKWELTGIVPFESACGKASNPSVYTRTSFYLNWINEQVTGNKSDDTRNQQKGESVSSKPAKCGLPSVSSSNRKKRLVGGDPAEEGKWPWQAALLDRFGTQFCGGALITNKHVLTSATCASRGNASDFQVRLGGYDLINQKFGKSKRFPVAKVHIYEQYRRSGSQFFNDIALLELSSGVAFSDDILHICLPQRRLSLDGRTAYVTSWGSTSKTTDFTDVVNEIQLPIWNQEECRERYEVWDVDITDDQLCAGDKIGGKDACTGDRGGPLVYQQSNGQWAVIGIVSFSKGCADPGIPGVFTRVDNYKEWIKSKALST